MTRMAQVDSFVDELAQKARQFKWYPNKAAELNAIQAELAGEGNTITHEMTVHDPGPTMRPGNPKNTPFTNTVLFSVNKGRAGNLTATEMSNAITTELSKIFAPVMTSPPALSGTGTVGSTLTCTTGNWNYVPTSYSYSWLRDGTVVGGGSNGTYTTVAADSGHTITCILTAHNAAGSTAAPVSNGIAIT